VAEGNVIEGHRAAALVSAGRQVARVGASATSAVWRRGSAIASMSISDWRISR
jgi:hypothetical protein